ncbi:MAG: TadG family pilus assembly protein [Pseudomonadota bacterium]
MSVGPTQIARARSRRRRAGNYALLFAIALVVLLGFGALAIDTSYMLLAHAQTQDLADATSQAALIVLRQTGDQGLAEAAANEVLGQNRIAGESPSSVEVTFGTWDDTEAVPSFVVDPVNPNAVRTTLGRSGADAVPFLLARLWGRETFNVSASATSATRSMQLIIVNDITGSWGERDFADSREAVLVALDMLAESASGQDQIGMTIFTNRYAWEYTPFTSISDPTAYAGVRADWELLNLASKAGQDSDHYDLRDCWLYSGTRQNDFSSPSGGCYPDMPREYRDEPGTDHSTGILLAKEMFEDSTTGANYRAMIVVTDGRPNGLGAASGTQRAADGYSETRWNEYVGPVPRTVNQIRTASIDACDDLWDELRVNTWVVSFVAHDSMMPAMVQGDGYYVLTSDSGELAAILAQIVSEMPLAIVE